MPQVSAPALAGRAEELDRLVAAVLAPPSSTPSTPISCGRSTTATSSNRFGESWRSITDTRDESTTWGRTPLAPGQWRPGPMAADRPLILCAICRQGDTLYVRPRLTEGDPRHGYGLVVGQSSVTRLTRDGVEIAPTVGRTGFPLAPGAGRCRLEHSTTVDDPDFRYGTAIRTVWDFTTTPAPTVNEPQPPYQRSNIRDQNPAAWQPVIFLSYEIPLALDKHGTGRTADLVHRTGIRR